MPAILRMLIIAIREKTLHYKYVTGQNIEKQNSTNAQ